MSEAHQMEESFEEIFGASASGTGEEELLKIAARFSRQLTARQMRCIIKLKAHMQLAGDKTRRTLEAIVSEFLELKQYHNSNLYVMRALDSVALRRFINENSVKINVQKQ